MGMTRHTKDSVAHENKQLAQARKAKWPSIHEHKVKGTAKGHGQKMKRGR